MLNNIHSVGFARLTFLNGDKGIFYVLCGDTNMDHIHFRRCPLCENVEIHRVLRRWEDYITDNRNSTFSIIGRIHS
jgi:hypothetical protein